MSIALRNDKDMHPDVVRDIAAVAGVHRAAYVTEGMAGSMFELFQHVQRSPPDT